MTDESDKPCTFLVHVDDCYPTIEVSGIKCALKHGDAAAKVTALKKALAVITTGDTPHFRDLPAIIVRNVLPCADADLTLHKLVLLYLETVYKGHDIYGRVPPDTSLVGDFLSQNLDHRDAYVRGLTLRFIARVAAQAPHDLLDELVVELVVVNLYHRHRFVRRHAVSAVFAIYYLKGLKKPDGDDALDHVEHRLSIERDAAAMRNALSMLGACARHRAVAYLLANAGLVVAEWPDIAQVAAVSLVHRACCCGSRHRGRLVRIVVSLSASSNSSSVVYEAAHALLSLCSGDDELEPAAVCAATNAYLRLLFSPLIDTDDEVKNIVMDRLQEMQGSKLSNLVQKYGLLD